MAAALTALAGLAGCGADQPGETAIPEAAAARDRGGAAVPVVMIPGMLGSRLANGQTGRTVWPSLADLLFGSDRLARLGLPLSVPAMARTAADAVVPAGIVRRAGPVDFYGKLIARLERDHGPCVAPSAIAPDTGCVLLAWDWRRDLVEAAEGLEQAVAKLRAARDAPGLRVDVVAHSAGGLVARYYARFGGTDVLDRPAVTHAPMTGARSLRRVILIATPNRGSIYGLQRVMRGERLGLSRLHPEVMATMPSIYQLLPHPDRDWMITVDGDTADIDLYDIASWRQFREAIFLPEARARLVARFPSPGARAAATDLLEARFALGLRRGARFHRALDAPPVPGVTAPQILTVAAGCRPTAAVCLVEEADGRPVIRLQPGTIRNPRPGVDYRARMIAPGDGRVTLASARAVPDSLGGLTVCADHDRLPPDPATVAAVVQFLSAP